MPSSRLRRLGAGSLVAGATALALAATPLVGLAAPTDEHAAAGRSAATWLAGEFVEGGLPGFTEGSVDWGLTIDGVLALAATGVDAPTRQAATTRIAANVRAYNSYDGLEGLEGFTDGGATAKLLYLATAVGADPTDFGGYDLRAEILSLIAGAGSGAEAGRITSRTTVATGPDASNTFDQSFTLLGLAGSGTVPAPAVDFLIKQQCTAGGFRLYPDFGGVFSCDAEPTPTLDVDSTAMAVQALLAADTPAATEAARRGADWLAAQQRTDGSFGGSGPTGGANSNSTGLAGQALAAAGRQPEATRAGSALATLQRPAGAAEAGAIAYSKETFGEPPLEPIPAFERDQWRRASAQALLGLAQVPLGQIEVPAPPTGNPTPTPSGSASPTPSPDPTGSPTPGPTGSPTASPTPSAAPSDTATPSASATPAPTATTPVAGTPGRLPTTGASLPGFLLVGLLLIGGGAALVVVGRRRRAG